MIHSASSCHCDVLTAVTITLMVAPLVASTLLRPDFSLVLSRIIRPSAAGSTVGAMELRDCNCMQLAPQVGP